MICRPRHKLKNNLVTSPTISIVDTTEIKSEPPIIPIQAIQSVQGGWKKWDWKKWDKVGKNGTMLEKMGQLLCCEIPLEKMGQVF